MKQKILILPLILIFVSCSKQHDAYNTSHSDEAKKAQELHLSNYNEYKNRLANYMYDTANRMQEVAPKIGHPKGNVELNEILDNALLQVESLKSDINKELESISNNDDLSTEEKILIVKEYADLDDHIENYYSQIIFSIKQRTMRPIGY